MGIDAVAAEVELERIHHGTMEIGFAVAIEYRIVDGDAAVALGVVVAGAFVVRRR